MKEKSKHYGKPVSCLILLTASRRRLWGRKSAVDLFVYRLVYGLERDSGETDIARDEALGNKSSLRCLTLNRLSERTSSPLSAETSFREAMSKRLVVEPRRQKRRTRNFSGLRNSKNPKPVQSAGRSTLKSAPIILRLFSILENYLSRTSVHCSENLGAVVKRRRTVRYPRTRGDTDQICGIESAGSRFPRKSRKKVLPRIVANIIFPLPGKPLVHGPGAPAAAAAVAAAVLSQLGTDHKELRKK